MASLSQNCYSTFRRLHTFYSLKWIGCFSYYPDIYAFTESMAAIHKIFGKFCTEETFHFKSALQAVYPEI